MRFFVQANSVRHRFALEWLEEVGGSALAGWGWQLDKELTFIENVLLKRKFMGKTGVLIAGPTASGKSALAISIAQKTDGLIINTDSMQVYDVLNILSARPQPEDLRKAEHCLYGHVPPSTRYSTGEWLRDAVAIMKSSQFEDRTLIFVGGTGLYFQALLEGITDVPPIAPDIVEQVEDEVAGLDRGQRIDMLNASDPNMAERLLEPDKQRLVRVISVLRATGKSLAYWQDRGQVGQLDDFSLEKIVVDPGRDVVRERIAQRFVMMMSQGADEEVQQILALGLQKNLPAMKAIGVREISQLLSGELSPEEAIERAITASHQYAKRQRTWFRKQMSDWEWRG